MNRISRLRAALALALATVLVLGTVPLYGATVASVHVDPVPSHAVIGVRDLSGLSDADARAAITTGCVVPVLRTPVVIANRHVFKFAAAGVVTVNVDATLQKAYSVVDTVTPFALTPVYTVNWPKISAWSAKIAKTVNSKPANARRIVKKGKLVLLAEKYGLTVNKTTTSLRIRALLYSELASSGLVAKPIYASITSKKAKITRANIGKAILIRLSKFTITLYKGGKVEKQYKCAVGMPAYPTPTGKFKVTGKVRNPVWHNPGSGWARNMPASIAGGRNNPLGTRAIYTSAPGIRMHGVPSSENWSIGHRASHGCLRMHRKDVENFYPRVPVGIPVWIIR